MHVFYYCFIFLLNRGLDVIINFVIYISLLHALVYINMNCFFFEFRTIGISRIIMNVSLLY